MMQLRLIAQTITAAAMVSAFTLAAVAAERVDVAPFGTAWLLDAQGHRSPVNGNDVVKTSVVEIEWREVRDIESVIVRGVDAIGPANVAVSYWGQVWPNNGNGGWARLDDPFKGHWFAAKTHATPVERGIRFEFEKLTKEENPV